ncbi:cytochrome c oxidase subunit 1 [Allomyces arbusculus]|nr:cytochrome c oxidase subunit 1 [Allomyces arbusculus]
MAAPAPGPGPAVRSAADVDRLVRHYRALIHREAEILALDKDLAQVAKGRNHAVVPAAQSPPPPTGTAAVRLPPLGPPATAAAHAEAAPVARMDVEPVDKLADSAPEAPSEDEAAPSNSTAANNPGPAPVARPAAGAPVRVKLTKRLGIGAAPAAHDTTPGPDPPPPIPYLRTKKPPRPEKRFEVKRLGMSISRFIEQQVSGSSWEEGLDGDGETDSGGMVVSSMKPVEKPATEAPKPSKAFVAVINPHFEPLELVLPTSLSPADFVEFLKRQAHKRAARLDHSTMANSDLDDDALPAVADPWPSARSLADPPDPPLLRVTSAALSSDRPTSPFHWTISPARFVLREPTYEAPTLDAVRSREFAAGLLDDPAAVADTGTVSPVPDDPLELSLLDGAFSHPLVSVNIGHATPLHSRCSSLVADPAPADEPDAPRLTPSLIIRRFERAHGMTRGGVSSVPSPARHSSEPTTTAVSPVNVTLAALAPRRPVSSSPPASPTPAPSSAPASTPTFPSAAPSRTDSSTKSMPARARVSRTGTDPPGTRLGTPGTKRGAAADTTPLTRRLVSKSAAAGLDVSSSSLSMDSGASERDYNMIEDTSEAETDLAHYAHAFPIDEIHEVVLAWPGHFDLISVAGFPSETDLYDLDTGHIKDHPAFHDVEWVMLTDPALPSDEDIALDIWSLLESKRAARPVTLFWLAKAGRTDEVLAKIGQELLSSTPASLLFLQAQLRVQLGHLDDAVRDLEDVLARDRSCAMAWSLKARLHHLMGPAKLCINAYTHVLKHFPKLWRFYYERGLQHENVKEVMYAFEDFKQVRALQPECVDAVWRHVHYYLDKELYEDAARTVQVILDRHPDDAAAVFLRGNAMAQLQNFARALEDMDAAIRLDPYCAEYYVHRACLLRDCHPAKALEDFSVALLLDDSQATVDALLFRGHVYYQLEKYELAQLDWIRVSELNSNAHLNLNLGILAMLHLDDYVQAMQFLDTAVDQDPLLLKAYLARAELYQLLHQESFLVSGTIIRKLRRRNAGEVSFLERATREYSRAIRMFPRDYILYLYRGRLLLRQKKTGLAMHDFHTAFELNSGIAQTFLQRSLILSFQGKYHQIIQEFRDQQQLGARFDANLIVLVAKAKMRTGDPEGALAVLSEPGLAAEPQIHLHKGLCYQTLHRYANAGAEFTKCVDLAPKFAKAYYHRGLCRLAANDAAGGLEDINEAVRQDPKMFEAYLTRAAHYARLEQFADGIEDCATAIRLEPASVRGYLQRGLLRCRLGQHTAAVADFTRVTEIDRDCVTAYFNRAATAHVAGHAELALRDYSTVLLMAGADARARRGRGFLYWQLGQWDAAVADLMAAAQYSADVEPDLFELLGNALAKVGKVDDAVGVFSKIVMAHPELVTGYLARANVFAQTGRVQEAIRDYARCLHIAPRTVDVHVNLGYVAYRQQHHRRAWARFSSAIALDPECTAALEARASIHLAKGNPVAAMADIEQAARVRPNDANVLINRGVIAQCLGDVAAAMHDYKRALVLDPGNALAAFNAANLYYAQQSWETAREFYDLALHAEPDDWHARINRTLTCFELGDYDQARKDIDAARALVRTKKDRAKVEYHAACLAQRQGKFADAERLFTQALILLPQFTDAWIKRAEIRGRLGNMTGALQDYAHAITLDSDLERPT